MTTKTLTIDLTNWRPVKEADNDVTVRKTDRSDIPELGRLYFHAYEPGVAGDSVDEATADIQASWDGVYGKFWPEGSAVAVTGGRIIGAVLTVKQAPWEDTPDGPFIIELFVDPRLRRRGIGRLLVTESLAVMKRRGAESASLRVLASNKAALALYRSIDFVDWMP